MNLSNEENLVEKYLSGKFPNKVKSVFTAILHEKGGKVLEVGCGYGAQAVFLALRGKDIVATDLSGERIDRAKLLAEKYKASLQCQVLDALTAVEEKFTTVYSFDMFEHLPYDSQEEHLKAVYAMLETNGKYYIRCPHLHNIRQHIPEHIGLPTYLDVARLGARVGFEVSAFVGHTRFTLPGGLYTSIEHAVLKIKKPERRYDILKKLGMANVVVTLKKIN